MNFHLKFLLILTVGIFQIPSLERNGTPSSSHQESTDDLVLVWSDEFEGNRAVDRSNWHHQTIPIINGVDWANNEEQHYTNRVDNSVVEDGVLKIIAKKEVGYQQNGVAKDYTSARLNSKFAFTYGRVDVRAKLPAQLGTWPAIWTLGQNINETGAYWQTRGFGTTPWPVTGEIDIMEQFGRSSGEKEDIHGSIHVPRSFGATENTSRIRLATSTDQFHVYSILWDEDEIKFLVDNQEYYAYNPVQRYGAQITNSTRSDMNWPFDEPQYLLLNVAMGGILGGTIPSNFTEGIMEVDYVRIYQAEGTLSLGDSRFILDDNVPAGTLVGPVSTDYLGGHSLVYSIIGGDEEGAFQVNSPTGTITVADGSALREQSSYTLTIQASDGFFTDQATITVDLNPVTVLSVDGVATKAFNAYPNPVQGTLQVTFEARNPPKLHYVTDLSGRILSIPSQVGVGTYDFDFSQEGPGTYLILLENEEGYHHLRVLKY